MRLRRLELREVRIPFRLSFRHARARRREARNLLLAVETGGGDKGYGEIVPRSYLTGESLESAWEDVLAWWPRLCRERFTSDPFRPLRPFYEEADERRRTAAWSGLDVAVVDAWCRTRGVSAADLLGGRGSWVGLTAPLGGGPLPLIGLTAWGFRLLGFQDFKLKLGGADDLRRAAVVRAVLGPDRDLRVDANGAWEVEQAVARARELARLGISSLEQPIPPGDPDLLIRVQEEGGLPVMADESLCTRRDARRLKGIRLWNLRLAKVGGFSGLRELLGMARARGIGVHLGVLVGETSLLAAAQRACLALGPFVHVEYGFPEVLLSCDPFRGGPGGMAGRGRPLGSRPGLGVEPVPRRLERVTVRRAVVE